MIPEEKSLAKSLFSKSILIYIFVILMAPTGYILKMKLAHELTVEQIGILYGMFSIGALIQSLNDFGITESINFFLSKHLAKKDYERAKGLFFFCFGITFLMGIVSGTLWYILSDYLAINYFQSVESIDLLKIFSLFFLGNNIFSFLDSFYNIVQNLLLQKSLQLARMILLIASVFFIYTLGDQDLWMIGTLWVGSFFLMSFISLLFFFFLYYRKYFRGIPAKIQGENIREIIQYSLSVMLITNIASLLHYSDSILITGFLGNEINGYYSMYLSLIGLPFLFLSPILGFIYPIIAGFYAKDETDKIILLRTYLEKIFLVLGLLLGIGLFVFAKPITVLIFGEKYLDSALILQASSLFCVFNFLFQIRLIILAGTGKTKKRIQIFSVGVLTNLSLNFIGILGGNYLFGPIAGAIGSALAVALSWIPICYLAGKYIEEYAIKIDWREIIQRGVISGGFIFLMGEFTRFIPNEDRISLSILLFLTMIGTLILLKFLYRKEILEFRKLITPS